MKIVYDDNVIMMNSIEVDEYDGDGNDNDGNADNDSDHYTS